MNKKHCNIVVTMLSLLLISSCSTVKNLPEGEVLYTGIKNIEVKNMEKSEVAEEAMVEVEAALSVAPNNSFFGSSSLRTPFPFGLWWYNEYVNSNSKLGKWFFKHFASTPVLLSQVNPKLRCRVAKNVLNNYGYFGGNVQYQVYPARNPRKSKVGYSVTLNTPLFWDSVAYLRFPPTADSLIRATRAQQLINPGEQFTASALNLERNRLSNLFRNNGYYYYQPGYITFSADTLQRPGYANLRVAPADGLAPKVTHPWHIGKVSIRVLNREDGWAQETDTLKTRRLTYYYSGKKTPVRPGIFLRRIALQQQELYTQDKQAETLTELSRLNIFSAINFSFTPRDTTATCDSLDLDIIAQLDKPYDLSFEMNVTSKSNSQIGPGFVTSVERHNIFRGGETFKVSLLGSYEWQTNNELKGRQAVINSWEIGADVSLKIPRFYFPLIDSKRMRYTTSSSFHLYANQLNRSGFFKMVSVGGEIQYTLQPQSTTTHTIIPFRLSYDMLQRTTAKFDSIISKNKALAQSFKNQFIPALQYTYTYDNTQTKHRNKTWFQASITESGNIISLVYMALGKGWNEKDKEIVYNPYAQFIKATGEVRQLFKINSKQHVATRFFAGIIKPYGNSLTAPYSEQFYAGGAGDIRAFTIRSIGPGSYHPIENNKYSYLDETGNLKLEANIEYRFPLFGNLYSALFIDAGNVWLIDKDSERPGGEFRVKTLWDDIAIGTGTGLRYDLDFLVLRLDWGIPLHAPYDTGKSGYFNITEYWRDSRIHFAIGYPF